MEKGKKDALARKNEIMETALRLFATKGYDETSTNDIIKELGLSRGGLYHHFNSKEDILESAIKTFLISERSRIELAINKKGLTAKDKLKIVMGLDPSTEPMFNEITILTRKGEDPVLCHYFLKNKIEIVVPVITNIIKEGIDEGVFVCRYPSGFSKIAVLLTMGLFTNMSITTSLDEFKDMIRVFQSICESELGVKKGEFDFITDITNNMK